MRNQNIKKINKNLNNKQKSKNKKSNKKYIQNIKNHNPPKKNISIYKRPKSSFKFINPAEKIKNKDNISSMSKNSFIKFLNKYLINCYIIKSHKR